MVHIPKDVPVFLDFLPNNLRDCVQLIKIYGQWLFTAERQGKYQLASDFENILDHLRYRYIKIQNLTDPESQFIVHLYEQMMPVEFHFSMVEQNDVAEVLTTPPEPKDKPVVNDSPTEDSVTLDPVTLAVDLKTEKIRFLNLAVTNKPIETSDLKAVIIIDAEKQIKSAPNDVSPVDQSSNIDIDASVRAEDTSLNSDKVIAPDIQLVQPIVEGTLKELQKSLDPEIVISRRRKPIKKHVRQMMNNIRHGAVILKEPDRNVAARNLIRAYTGCAVVHQKDYICIADSHSNENQTYSPHLREFVLSIMSEAKNYDIQ